jgi:hypothetical protein
MTTLIPPHGIEAVEAFYGWHDKYLEDLFAWEAFALRRLVLPRALSLGNGKVRNTLRVHFKLVEVFERVYSAISRAGLWDMLEPFAGDYAFRLVRGGTTPSLHSYGAAVDHDAAHNQLGAGFTLTRMGGTDRGRKVVAIFQANGFTWGGLWARPDAMHFQFATGC